jgi:predicted DNA-binding transcriptional regulator AlpA
MPVEVDGVEYFAFAEVIAVAGISRQTLYRWMNEGKVPAPKFRRRRDNRPLFTPSEVEAVRAFAGQVEPVSDDSAQLSLFPKTRERS